MHPTWVQHGCQNGLKSNQVATWRDPWPQVVTQKPPRPQKWSPRPLKDTKNGPQQAQKPSKIDPDKPHDMPKTKFSETDI